MPHEVTALFATQAPPQRLKFVLQAQAWVATSQVSLELHWASSAQPGLQVPFARSQYESPAQGVDRQSGAVWQVELVQT